MAYTTSKPTGLTIKRDVENFIFNWKKGDNNYDAGQNFSYSKGGEWINKTVGKKETEVEIEILESDFFPHTEAILSSVGMKVQGKRSKFKKNGKTIKPKVSEWAEYYWTMNPPKLPVIKETLDSELWNKCTFEWTVEISDSDNYWFVDTEWQTMLVKDSNVEDGGKLVWDETQYGWDSGFGTNEGSQVYEEDTFDIVDGSFTRWFRVRSRGAGGASEWSYSRHVYALTYQANVDSVVATVQPTGGFQCRVIWDAPSTPAHPIDKTTVEYTITVPEENLTCPDEASWVVANTSADTSEKDAIVFPIDRLLSANQCLFVRVNTEHDRSVTYGLPVLAEGGVGVLSDPVLTNVVLGDNYRVTVTATNSSDVPDSYLVILYRPASDPTSEIVIGTIAHGETTANVQAPDWSGETAFAFGVYAAIGDPTTISHDGAVMKSSIVWGTGDVPKAPENVRVSATNITGTVRVEWDWTWTEADGAEISWSDHEDAWESTDQPEVFELSNIRNSRWNISGLETGMKWYIRVRLKKGSGDNETFGAYSEIAVIDLTSAPSVPTLVLSESVITEDGSVTASWVYTTTDGTAQIYAEVCEAEITSSGVVYGRIIAHTETTQHVTISAEDVGWETGQTYNLCVRVISASGRVSDDWSAPVAVTVAEPITVEIVSSSLVEEVISNRTVTSLKELPLELELSSSDATVTIERAESYRMSRPDETVFDGYKGETVALKRGNVTSIGLSDLIGSLDDGAAYRIIATVKDDLGQSASTEVPFEVHWTHQALMPDGTVQIDGENLVAMILPTAPVEADETDTVDIYRLSSDRPQLIVKGGTFGETYVDPYVPIGQFGGYRLVYRTANDDYITEDNELAWVDLIDETLEIDYTVIDFDGGQIMLHYNVDVSSTWEKDFQETKYLGGSVQGDWNPAVSRTSSVSAVTITISDEEEIEMIRRLAASPTLCHVRTKDGSSYSADVQVAETYSHDKRGKIAAYTFTITRVDPEGLDGMTLAQWNSINEEEEDELEQGV